MKKIIGGLTAALILLPAVPFAQATAAGQASITQQNTAKSDAQAVVLLSAFQQQQIAQQVAFSKQQQADKDAFIAANPDVKSYLDKRAARLAKWTAAHPKK